ncbi:hypothetical protein FHG87_013743 [Trinorchestia longiramus]|nr:hypothetical protein FHG87_013743 [Trinorchestia longiramus]
MWHSAQVLINTALRCSSTQRSGAHQHSAQSTDDLAHIEEGRRPHSRGRKVHVGGGVEGMGVGGGPWGAEGGEGMGVGGGPWGAIDQDEVVTCAMFGPLQNGGL